MQELPIGMQNFESIRRNNNVYVDKTEKLLELAKTEKSYFFLVLVDLESSLLCQH